jgi:hypothetical protein
MSLSATAGGSNSLAVPRYVDEGGNPRPSKSPRHAGHQSVHSASSSIANTDSSAEYRYGPSPYASVNAGDGISPQTTQAPLPPPPPYGAAQDNSNTSSGQSSATTQQQPPRDYFPSSTSWTTTAGEQAPQSVSAYNGGAAGGDGRAYGFQDQYKAGAGLPGLKQDQTQHQGHQPPPPPVYPNQRGSFDALNHYSWNAT